MGQSRRYPNNVRKEKVFIADVGRHLDWMRSKATENDKHCRG